VNIYQNIVSAKKEGKKLLAVLIDPEKMDIDNLAAFFEKVHQSIATHIFVGGSTDEKNQTENLVSEIKKRTKLPIVLFPGDVHQITNSAD
jgi:heptaprenylglyceryl phosphate synthase